MNISDGLYSPFWQKMAHMKWTWKLSLVRYSYKNKPWELFVGENKVLLAK
jgi:hypothetical protein